MANDYYNHGSFPTTSSLGSSALMRAELDSIAAGFDKLPSATALQQLPVDAKSKGAKGDGVTDDTAAIQAALTAGAGGLVYLPPGTYITTDALSIPANTWFYGAGKGSVIKSLTLVNGGTNASHRQIDIRGVAGVRVTDMTLDSSLQTGWTGGMRSIIAFQATDFRIERVHFKTNGAATACLDSSYYWILDCDIEQISSDGTSKHDGVIDQWYGSHHFVIRGNRIRGNGIGRYGILVTGQDTSGSSAPCYDFLIDGNEVSGQSQSGIWAMGRDGLVYRFQIVNNKVLDISAYYGLVLSEAYDFVASGNVIRNTAYAGIRAYNETSYTAAADNSVIANNVVVNANTSTSVDDVAGSAITVSGLSAGLSISNNRVTGTTHRYAIYLSGNTSNCEVDGDCLATGVSGLIYNGGSGNRIPGGGIYQPTLTAIANVSASTAYSTTMWKREGNTVYVSGRLEVTPTAAASTDTQLGISLPVASNFADANTAAGVGSTSFGIVAAIYSDAVNDRAVLRFPAPNTLNNIVSFSFQYRVL